MKDQNPASSFILHPSSFILHPSSFVVSGSVIARGKQVPDFGLDECGRLHHLLQVDARANPQPVEHEHEVLGGEVPRRPRRVRTAAEPTGGPIERGDAGVEGGEDVRQRGASRVVKVQRHLGKRHTRCDGAEHPRNLAWMRDADRVADGDLEHATAFSATMYRGGALVR